MENPTSGLVPLGKIEMWIMLLGEGDQANICSIHLYEDYFLWNMELDDGDNDGDNIDTSILIVNDNGDGGATGLGRRYPWLLPGRFM